MAVRSTSSFTLERLIRRYGLTLAALAIFLVLLSASLFQLVQEQKNLTLNTRDLFYWHNAQTEYEVLRLINVLEQFGRNDPTIEHEDVLLRFDILWSRLTLYEGGTLKESLRQRFTAAAVADLQATLQAIEADVQALTPDNSQQAYELIRLLKDKLADLHQATIDMMLDETHYYDGIRERLVDSYQKSALFLGGVLVLGSLLFIVLFFENRRSWQEAQRRRAELVSTVIVIDCSLDGHFINLHPRFCELLGYTEAELKSLRFQDITHPDDLASYRQHVEMLKRGESQSFTVEKRYLCKDGSPLWVTNTCSIATDEQGRPQYLHAYLHDITARKQAEEQWQHSEQRLRDFAESVSDWFWETDTQHRIKWLPEQFERVTGIAPSKLIGKTRVETVLANSEAKFEYQTVMNARKPFRDFEFQSPRKRWIRLSGVPVFDNQGGFQGYRGTGKDITTVRESQLAIAQAQERFRDFANASSDWFWETDSDMRYTWISEKFDVAIGIPRSFIIGKTIQDLFDGDANDPTWLQHLERLRACESFRDFEYKTTNGQWVRVSGVPMFERDWTFCGYRGTGTNITAFRLAQQQASQAQAQLLQAIEALPIAIALYDDKDCLLVCNEYYRANVPEIRDSVQTGATFEAKLRKILQQGWIDEARGREVQWLEARLNAHRQGWEVRAEIRISDDRWLEMREHPLADGKLIVTEFDISESKRMELALRKNDQQMRLLADNLPVMLVYIDADERYGFVNARYADFIGQPVKKIIGQRIQDVVSEHVYSFLKPHIDNALAGNSGMLEAQQDDGQGQRIYQQMNYVPHIPDDGPNDGPNDGDDSKVIGYYMVIVDITERKQVELALREATNAAEAANQAKTEFLAKMSHEIRTPMNGVLGMAELLQDTDLDQQQQQFLQTVQSSGEALLSIINDIFDFTKIEAGQLSLDESEFDLPELAQSTLDMLSSRAQSKGLTLRSKIDPLVPKLLLGDSGRLRQIVVNLLNNAITYTHQGHIELRIKSVFAQVDDRLCLRMEVEDTGIGIAPELHEHIFDAFAQADDSHRRQYGGTGLGLAICRELAALMGGEIGVESQAGHGSTFWFTVMLDPVDPVDNILPIATESKQNETITAHVLLAEDNLINQQVARMMLEQLGCSVNVVGDGHAAIAANDAQRFDLIFMDCQMPGMDGYEAAQEIRQHEQTGNASRTPIIALTANVLPEDIRRCRTVGMDDHLGKPISKQHLRSVLQRWLPEKLSESSLH